jgi:acetyl esterase/lipase
MRPLLLLLLLTPLSLWAVRPSNQIIPLWDGTPPNHRASDLVETVTQDARLTRIAKVQDPSIEVRLPAGGNATGQAVVICPGGGYGILAYDWEGTDIANWLNSRGIAGIVLKYRLPEDASNEIPHFTPLLDAKRALRLVRSHATEWGIDPHQIGVMGFSAGGHLASTLGTQYDVGDTSATDPIDRISSRPDFMILMYPVISFDPAVGHSGSRRNLLGEQDSPELVDFYSGERNVTTDTPPTFLVHAFDDKSVPVQNSLRFYEALLAHNVPSEMHLYPDGGHGFGLAVNRGHLETWTDRCIDWLRSLSPPNPKAP